MEASESSGQSRPGQSGAMLPTIGKVGGQQTPARSRERPHSRAGSGRGKSATARRAVSAIALTDSEDSSFGESEVDSPAKPTRGPSAQYRASSAGKARGAPSSASMGRRGGGSPPLEPGLGMSRRQRENDPQPRDRSDRSRVEHDRTKPVGRTEQVYSMKQQRVDVSDSTGEDSEGDATGRRVLQQQREHRSKSRGKSASRQGKSRDRARSARTQTLDGSDGDDSEHVGSVRTKYGVQIKVDKVNMDKFADFDNMVRSQTRDGRRATRSDDVRRTQDSALATMAQREALEQQVGQDLSVFSPPCLLTQCVRMLCVMGIKTHARACTHTRKHARTRTPTNTPTHPHTHTHRLSRSCRSLMTSQASGSVGSCAIRSGSSVPLKRPSAS